MNSPLKGGALVVILLTVVWGIVAFSLSNPKIVGLYHDDGLYIALSKALASGQGYRIISLPDQPTETKYPPLFPLLLTPVWWLSPFFPSNIIWFKGIVIFCGAVLLFVSHQFFVKVFRLGAKNSLLLLALLVTNPTLLSTSQWVLAEIPYALLSMSALLFFETYCGQDKRGSLLRLALLASLAGCCYLIKTQGIVLVLAILLFFAIKRRYEDLLIFLSFSTIYLAGWFAWVSFHSSPGVAFNHYYVSYRNSMFRVNSLVDFARLAEILCQNVKYLASSLNYFLVPLAPIPVAGTLLPIALVSSLHGLVLVSRRVSLMTGIYMLGFLFCIVLLPWHPFRYLVPIVPLILGTVAVSVLSVFQKLKESQSRVGKIFQHPIFTLSFAFVVGAILSLNMISVFQALQQKNENYLPSHNAFFDRKRRWQGFEETFRWLRENTQEQDILGSSLDPVYFLYTNRRGTRFWLHNPETYFYPDWASARPAVGEVGTIIELLKEIKAKWLIRDPISNPDFKESEATDKLAQEILKRAYPKSTLSFVSSDMGHWVYQLEW